MSNSDDGLLVPRKGIVSLDEAREQGEAKRNPKANLGAQVTRGWALETFSKISVELGQKMYDQVSGELSEHLEEMERRLYHAIKREVEARSFMGRVRTLTRNVLLRFGAKQPALKIEPPPTPDLDGMEGEVGTFVPRGVDDAVHTHEP